MKAFNMFRDWTMNVIESYPKLSLTIIDETIIVNDLIESIKAAREGILKEEKIENRAIQGFDIGFMLGFIYSHLNEKWEYEYIVKQSDSYKEFIAIKSIKIFLEIDNLTAIRIKNIYKHLLTEDINFEKPDISISIEKLNELIQEESDVFLNNEILQALDNKINRYINASLKKSSKTNYMEPCEKYFSENEITEIVLNGLAL